MEQEQAPKRNIARSLILALLLVLAAVLLAVYVGRMLERRTYLLNYPNEIEHSAAEYALDPYLVAAVIHVESGNRPEVISSAGAVGLMQIMPDTGEWIAGKLKMEPYSVNMLKTPQTNICFGCWYMRFLLDRYSQNREHALAAYNAGHGNVDKWLNDPAVTRDGELVNIPFRETAEYGKKVQRAYDKYKTLYPKAF